MFYNTKIGNSGSKYDLNPEYFEEDLRDSKLLGEKFKHDIMSLVNDKEYSLNRKRLSYFDKRRLLREILIEIIEGGY